MSNDEIKEKDCTREIKSSHTLLHFEKNAFDKKVRYSVHLFCLLYFFKSLLTFFKFRVYLLSFRRFVFSNMTMLLSKLLHSTADQPVADWEDKVISCLFKMAEHVCTYT